MARLNQDVRSDIRGRAGDAIARALDFLARNQLPSGEFRIFTSKRQDMADDGEPDPSVFPTALIVQSLAFAPAGQALRERALRFLLAQRDSNGLWRHWTREHPHFRKLPPDLDDSSCVSAALVGAGMQGSTVPELLLANRDSRALFYTWFTPRLRWSGSAHLKVTLPQLLHAPTLYAFFKGTSAAPADVDAVVNANCLAYLGDYSGSAAVVDLLLDVLRRGAETQCDKWYENAFAVRYFFSRALSGTAPEAAPLMQERLAARPGNPLELALAVSSRLCWHDIPNAGTIAELLSHQSEDGSWPRASLYTGGRERRRDGSLAPAHPDTPHWGSEELSTAFCVEALGRWLAAGRR